MSKEKINVNVIVRLTIEIEEGTDIDEVITEMDYNFASHTETATIVDTEIREYKTSES